MRSCVRVKQKKKRKLRVVEADPKHETAVRYVPSAVRPFRGWDEKGDGFRFDWDANVRSDPIVVGRRNRPVVVEEIAMHDRYLFAKISMIVGGRNRSRKNRTEISIKRSQHRDLSAPGIDILGFKGRSVQAPGASPSNMRRHSRTRCAFALPRAPRNVPFDGERRCFARVPRDEKGEGRWTPKPWTSCLKKPTSRGGTTRRCNGIDEVRESAPTFENPIGGDLKAETKPTPAYNIEGWGGAYFKVNENGNLAIRPLGDRGPELDGIEIVERLESVHGIKMPLVLRFPEILLHRLQELQDCFDVAIQRYEYEGSYQAIFPIKCNHDNGLLRDLMEGGKKNHVGLEVGSRPELLIAISLFPLASERSVVICNGYKDETYIKTAFQASQLGIHVIIVLEHPEELAHVVKLSSGYERVPDLGVRARLNAKHNGHWGSTSGEKSKFGLGPVEILSVVEQLKKECLLSHLKLLHFHIGSQIPTISLIKEAMREASHIYSELYKLGAPMGNIDVGGGLAIDYDGHSTEFGSTINYNMQNYANDIVASLQDVCLQRSMPPPRILSESGRALASHHSILVFDARGPKSKPKLTNTFGALDLSDESIPSHFLLKNFEAVYQTIEPNNVQESLNDAQQFVGEARSLFKLGMMSLEERAYAESLFDACCEAVHNFVAQDASKSPEDFASALSSERSVWYHANLSIFRSAPDAWAIQQVFPVIPMQRLHERPVVSATFADLTCDSDGKIDNFGGGNRSLPLHAPHPDSKYVLGLFLGGVYQEVMGSNHNMFGTTNVAHITTTSEGFRVKRLVRGQSIGEVLSTCQHYPEDMRSAFASAVEGAVSSGHMNASQGAEVLHHLSASLDSYTYLQP